MYDKVVYVNRFLDYQNSRVNQSVYAVAERITLPFYVSEIIEHTTPNQFETIIKYEKYEL